MWLGRNLRYILNTDSYFFQFPQHLRAKSLPLRLQWKNGFRWEKGTSSRTLFFLLRWHIILALATIIGTPLWDDSLNLAGLDLRRLEWKLDTVLVRDVCSDSFEVLGTHPERRVLFGRRRQQCMETCWDKNQRLLTEESLQAMNRLGGSRILLLDLNVGGHSHAYANSKSWP